MLLAARRTPLVLDTMRIGALAWAIIGDAGLGRFALKAAALALRRRRRLLRQRRPRRRDAPLTAGLFAGAGALAPLVILVVVYLRHVPFETRPAIGIAALVMAAVFATLTERLIARRPDDDKALAPALYAAGAVLALSFAFAVGLATRFIPISLSLGAAGVVWVSLYRPVAALSWLAVVGRRPRLRRRSSSARPSRRRSSARGRILNGLILRFGLPAAAVLFAGETLRRHRDGIEAQHPADARPRPRGDSS